MAHTAWLVGALTRFIPISFSFAIAIWKQLNLWLSAVICTHKKKAFWTESVHLITNQWRFFFTVFVVEASRQVDSSQMSIRNMTIAPRV